MEILTNFNDLFLSVWNKGIVGIDFTQILIGLGIFFIFLIFRGLISKLIIKKLETEDGEKAFTVADKPIIRGFEPIKLSNIGASIIGEVTSVEEAEKN